MVCKGPKMFERDLLSVKISCATVINLDTEVHINITDILSLIRPIIYLLRDINFIFITRGEKVHNGPVSLKI